MGNFIKKDILILVRDRKELAILILMPFILIAILGFALGNIINGDSVSLDLNFALVVEDDEASGRAKVLEEIDQSQLPEEVKAQLLQAAAEIQPQAMLRGVIDSEKFRQLGSYQELTLEEGKRAIEQDEAAVLLIVPEDYTYNMLRKMLLDSGDGARLLVESSSKYPLSSGIFQDVMESFSRTVSYETALGQISASKGQMAVEWQTTESPVHGGVEFIPSFDPIRSIQYYTFGMAVMFIMYAATSIASRAYNEKENVAFDRIVIAGTNPLAYLAGKAISAAMLVFLQLVVLFGMSTLCFGTFAGKSLEFWLALLLVMAVLAICMGGLAALLTTLNFRAENYRSTQIFGGLFVTLLSFLGGSFFPTSAMSEAISYLGGWTPNGAALNAFVQITQGAGMERYLDFIVRLLFLSGSMFIVSFWLFPRRRMF